MPSVPPDTPASLVSQLLAHFLHDAHESPAASIQQAGWRFHFITWEGKERRGFLGPPPPPSPPPHSPGIPPSNQLSAGLPPCCHVALELSQQCGVVVRQGEGSSSCLIPLLLTVSPARPGPARISPARPGSPSQPRTHLS